MRTISPRVMYVCTSRSQSSWRIACVYVEGIFLVQSPFSSESHGTDAWWIIQGEQEILFFFRIFLCSDITEYLYRRLFFSGSSRREIRGALPRTCFLVLVFCYNPSLCSRCLCAEVLLHNQWATDNSAVCLTYPDVVIGRMCE